MLESCGLTGSVEGNSVRVPLRALEVREQVEAVERVRLVAHAHGWSLEADSAAQGGDHVPISPGPP